MNGKALLLTGASGVLGQALLRRLLRDGVELVCLRHRTTVNGVPPGSRFEVVRGDLTAPFLGLGAEGFAALAARIGGIVHSAAATGFTHPAEVAQSTNVEGTRRIVELAEAAGAPLFHVSTAFAYLPPAADGTAPERNAYEESKREAEEVVRAAAVPVSILRPSLLIGDSDTGEMPSLQGLHMLLILLLRNLLPVLPADADARVDFLPRDLVADRIANLLKRAGEDLPEEVWLTAGDRALTLRQLLEHGSDFARRELGREVVPPRIVAPEMFDRLIRPVFLPAMPPRVRQSFERLLPLTKYLVLRTPFPSSLGPEPLGLEEAFQRNMVHVAGRSRLLEVRGE